MRAREILPDADASIARATLVEADPETTYRALHHAEIDQDPFVRGMTWIRELPQRALGLLGQPTPEPRRPGIRIPDLMGAAGCLPLADEPGEGVAYGAVGRPWDPRAARMGPRDVDSFHAFDEPHAARCVIAFALVPHGSDRTLLVLEIRAQGTDRGASRTLRRLAPLARVLVAPAADRLLGIVQETGEMLARIEAPDREPAPKTPAAEPVKRAHGMPTIDALDLDGARVLLRVDANEPVREGRPAGRHRLNAAARSIQALLDQGASVAVLTHQGRPGGEDFISLEGHAEILSEILGRQVTYLPHIDDDEAPKAVRTLDPGEVLLLENVRMAEGETTVTSAAEHADRAWVRALADAADAYVDDAFSVCHRAHASVVAFPSLLPSAAGPALLSELDHLDRFAAEDPPRIAALGGAKLSTTIDFIGHQLATDHLDRVLLAGLPGLLFLEADGHDTGEGTRSTLNEHGALEHLKPARALLNEHRERIELPEDVAVRRSGDRMTLSVEDLPGPGRVLDIGRGTVDRFATYIQDAGAALLHGPPGRFEEPPFERGTNSLLRELSTSDAYTIVGGGHTLSAIDELGIDTDGFDRVSLGGGAMLTYLSEDPLPGCEALGSLEA